MIRNPAGSVTSHQDAQLNTSSSTGTFLDCASAACVRACTNPRVCARVRVRAGGGSEQSRTVQQAQAAGRAGEAAKKYSSRYLKLRGEQRSVRTSACTVRTEPPNPPCSFPHTQTGALDACWYLFYFI